MPSSRRSHSFRSRHDHRRRLHAFGLARHAADGALDRSFGVDGKVITDFADGRDDSAKAVALQPDGRLVVAGSAGGEDGTDFALARYQVDGTLDSSFGEDGKVTTEFLDSDVAHAIAIQPDGRIVAAGRASARTTSAGGFALARYAADGSLDAAGDDDGRTITAFYDGEPSSATAMAVQPDGRIVLAGATGDIPCSCDQTSDFAVARFKAAGSWPLDPPGHREIHACVNGSFVDLNAVLGVPEQIVCDATINAGEPWRPLAFWYVGDASYEVPPGYVPAAATPIADLVGKLEAVKVIVDGGTKHEITTVFSPAAALRTDVTLDRFVYDAPPFPVAVTLPRIRPLKVGEHVVEVVWVLDAMHCDGLGVSVADNCLPAGDVSFGARPINVASP
jgi:uncharacterized delta-60 repeat protein